MYKGIGLGCNNKNQFKYQQKGNYRKCNDTADTEEHHKNNNYRYHHFNGIFTENRTNEHNNGCNSDAVNSYNRKRKYLFTNGLTVL